MIRPSAFPARALLAPALCALGLSALAGCMISIGSSFDGMHKHSTHSSESIRGSGVRISEARTLGEFTRIRVQSGADVHVRIGPEKKCELSFDDNLLPHVQTKVEDGELRITMDNGSYDYERSLQIELTLPALEAITIAGSGSSRIEGLAGASFKASIEGSGDVQATGKVERFEGSVSGSGDLNCYELLAREVVVTISGSGDAHVNASERLQAAIAGSGDVRYRGGASDVHKSIAGSGSVRAD